MRLNKGIQYSVILPEGADLQHITMKGGDEDREGEGWQTIGADNPPGEKGVWTIRD